MKARQKRLLFVALGIAEAVLASWAESDAGAS